MIYSVAIVGDERAAPRVANEAFSSSSISNEEYVRTLVCVLRKSGEQRRE